MTRRPSYIHINLPALKKHCKANGYLYKEYNDGQQVRVWGATRLVDIWPSRMVYHVIEDEDATPTRMQKWPRMDIKFNESQVKELLAGGVI